MYQHFRLWVWWTLLLKRDRHHPSLRYNYLYDKYKVGRGYGFGRLSEIIERQRNILHLLNTGERVRDIPPDVISRAEI